MDLLLWILAVILIVFGIVNIVRGAILWGVVLIILGLLVGPGGVSIFDDDNEVNAAGIEHAVVPETALTEILTEWGFLPEFPTNCYPSYNLANNPDNMAGRCVKGSGSFRWVLRCYLFDGGPYYNYYSNWVTVASGNRSYGSCSSRHPLMRIDLSILQRRS